MSIKYFARIVSILIVCLMANIPVLTQVYKGTAVWLLLAACFLWVNIFPSPANRKLPKWRLRICADGCELLKIFLISSTCNIMFMLLLIRPFFPENKSVWFINCLVIFLVEAVVFWNGMIRVYGTSRQIGIKWRVIGILCGWIPLANLWALWRIIEIASQEPEFESGKIQANELRAGEELCRTRYPLLLVHGVFFRDFRYFNYWGRIPGELEKNGARIYYGNHQSAASVADSAEELAERIKSICEETGCGKVNILAHSKGGLDCRYAISKLGMSHYVASLTTINTPHRGCIFADYLLEKVPEPVKEKLAAGYHAALKKMGDTNPDFLAAVTDLTASACKRMNEEVTDVPGVYYQSVGSRMNKASGGRFPLNCSHHLVKYFDGPNDGLVSLDSFPWGEDYQLLTTEHSRGISHGDMIDLNRENIRGFDVREFYVQLVNGLKEKGF